MPLEIRARRVQQKNHWLPPFKNLLHIFEIDMNEICGDFWEIYAFFCLQFVCFSLQYFHSRKNNNCSFSWVQTKRISYMEIMPKKFCKKPHLVRPQELKVDENWIIFFLEKCWRDIGRKKFNTTRLISPNEVHGCVEKKSNNIFAFFVIFEVRRAKKRRRCLISDLNYWLLSSETEASINE